MSAAAAWGASTPTVFKIVCEGQEYHFEHPIRPEDVRSTANQLGFQSYVVIRADGSQIEPSDYPADGLSENLTLVRHSALKI